MVKRGQIYLIAVILIATVLIGFLTASNILRKEKNFPLEGIDKEIQFEREKLLDYISSQQKSEAETYELMVNFSREFQNRIGSEKDIVFVFGNSSNLTLLGNRNSDTNMEYAISSSFINITTSGEFLENLNPNNSSVAIRINNNTRNYNLHTGQNIYYLIKYNYNEEVYIIND